MQPTCSVRHLFVLPLLLLVAACDSNEPPPGVTVPLTLAQLLPAPTASEVAAIRSDWTARNTAAQNVAVEASGSLTWGAVPMRYTVYRHTVAGERHVGVVLVPEALGVSERAPVLVYTKGGYTGLGGFDAPVEQIATRLPGEPLRSRLVYVIPAYRGERLQVAGTSYLAAGQADVGNFDVDDTMALLSVALDRVPQADAARVAVVGESRGALVALEMAARDPRVDLVVDAYGPTDFRQGFANVPDADFQASVRAAIENPTDLTHLLTRSLLPLDQITVGADGSLAITAAGLREARLRLARTAPVAYVADLPVTQVHHGTADATASVASSRALAAAFAAAGRPSGSGTFTYFEYDGGQHDVTTLSGYFARVGDVLTRTFGL